MNDKDLLVGPARGCVPKEAAVVVSGATDGEE